MKNRKSVLILLITAVALSLGAGYLIFFRNTKEAHIKRGDGYYASGKYREAVIEFKSAVKKDPKDAQAHYKLALASLRAGGMSNLNSAFNELSKAVELDGNITDAQLKLGELYLLTRDYKKAREKAELVIQQSPDSMEGHILLGRSMAELKDLDAAVDMLKKGAQLKKESILPHLNLAQVYIMKSDFSSAEESYKTAISIDGKAVEPRLGLTKLYIMQKRYDVAEEELNSIVAIRPDDPVIYIMLGEFYLRSGNHEKAEEAYKNAVAKAPDNDNAVTAFANFYLKENRLEDAKAALRDGIEKRPDSPLKKRLAELMIAGNEIKEASTIVDEILKKDSKDPDALYLKGRLYLVSGDTDKAIDAFGASIKEEPNRHLPHYYLSAAYILKGDVQQAKSELETTLKLASGFNTARLDLAALHLKLKSYDIARTEIEKFLKEEPTNARGHLLAGDAAAGRKDLAQAERHYSESIRLLKNNFLGHFRLGIVQRIKKDDNRALSSFEESIGINKDFVPALQQIAAMEGKKDPDRALRRVEKQLSLSPQNASMHHLKGIIYLSMKRNQEAEDAFKKAVELNNKLSDVYLALGNLYSSTGKIKEAIAQYETMAGLQPTSPTPYMLLGTLYQSNNDIDKAKSYYQKVLDIDPKFGPAANNLACIHADHGGNLDVALNLAQTAREQLPEDPAVADTLGWIYYRKNSFLNAVSLLEEAAEKIPNNSEIRYHLGMALYKKGDKERAKKELNTALKLSSDFKGADDARKTLEEIK